MNYHSGLPARKPNRLEGHDYSADGIYFITICTKDKQHTLSRIVASGDAGLPPQPALTPLGMIVEKALSAIPEHYRNASVLHSVIMPNHIHVLLKLDAAKSSEVRPVSVATVIGQMKRAVSRDAGTAVWQKGYYDHIIRNDRDYQVHWEYIDANPAKRSEDEYNQP